MSFLKQKNFLILSFAFLLLTFAYNSAEQYLTSFYASINAEPIATTSLLLIYLSIIIGHFVGPFIIRKLGIKYSFICGFLLYTLFIFSVNFGLIYLTIIFSILLGIGAGINGLTRIDFIRLSSPKEERGEYFSIIELTKALGGFIGIFLTGLILRYLGFVNTYFFLGIIGVIAVVTLCFMKKSETLETVSYKVTITKLITYIKDLRILLLMPIGIIQGFLLGLIIANLPIIITHNLSITWIGVIISIYYLINIIFLVIGGYESDKKGRYVILYTSLVFYSIALILALLPVTLLSLILEVIFLGLGSAFGNGAYSALIIDTFEGDSEEATAVLKNLGLLLGIVPSFLISGILPINIIIVISFILIFISFISLYILKRYKIKSLQSKAIL